MAKRPKLRPPVNRQGVKLFKFGDETLAGGWSVGGWTAVGSGVWYPGHRIVADDEGEQWVEVVIPETPPTDRDARAQWHADQRDLEQIDRRTKNGRGDKLGEEKREALADRNAKLIDRARNVRALDPDIGRWALAGRLRCEDLTQQQIYRIIRPAYDD